MPVLWARLAVQDLVSIRNYIGVHHPPAARRFAAEMVETAELLAANPHLGTALARPGYRRLVVGGSVYVLIYRITPEATEILEVFDARRKKPRTALT
jgi:toxin ParE1/3/4